MPLTNYQLTKYDLPRPPLRVDGHERADARAIKRHVVGLLSKPDDFACLLLASLGQSAKSIARVTGLSVGQISYRLKMAHIQLRDYRNGNNAYSRMVVRGVNDLAAKQLAIDVQAVPGAKL